MPIEQNLLEDEDISQLVFSELTMIASSKVQAEYLEAQRVNFYQDLDDDICTRTSSMGYDYNNPVTGLSVEDQALRRIDQKEAYERNIVKLKSRYARWEALLESFTAGEVELLRNCLEFGTYKDSKGIEHLLNRIVVLYGNAENVREDRVNNEISKRYLIAMRNYLSPNLHTAK